MSTPSDEDSQPNGKVIPPPGASEEDEEEEEELIVQGTKKLVRGKVWKSSVSGDYVRYRDNEGGTDYCPGDAVYIESQRPEQPYYVCAIQSLKMSKRDNLMVHVKWFYRTSEVPEQVYQLLVQDRHTEHGSKKYDVIHDPVTRKRELFISDATDIYPVSVLRGKCTVYHCSDFISFRNFVPEKDTFFYTLSYNPETRRLASTQGEIRVGASHQAKLPELEIVTDVSERPNPKEDLAWEPGRIHDHDLLMYLRAGRSMAAFAAMCDGGSTEDGFAAASRDSITANAIKQLHDVGYDTEKALQNLLKKPYPSEAAREWKEEDVKDFIKGIRVYGKNFFKIKMEFLPQKETSDLINFYYLWKKSPGAANNRPRGRRHRPNVMRRIKSSKTAPKAIREDPTDLSSASEVEDCTSACEDSSENGEKALSPYYCRHCYTTSSKDWHHASKEKILVCTECRMYFKKYGELPTLDPRKEVVDDDLQDILDENESVKREDEEETSTANASPAESSAPATSGEDTSSTSAFKKEEPTDTKKEEMKLEIAKDESATNEEEETPQRLTLLSKVGEDLNLSAIEQDSKIPSPAVSSSALTLTTTTSTVAKAYPPLVTSSFSFAAPNSSTATTVAPSFGPKISHIPLNLHQPHLSTPQSFPTSRPLGFGVGPPPSLPPHHHHHHPHHMNMNMFHGGIPSPLEMKAELPKNILGGLFSPVATNMRTGLHPPGPIPGLPHPMSFAPPSSSSPYNRDPEVQILHHSRSTPTPPTPQPREPSPPPKPDGSECHRSQSAIFIRNWNRGETNSCARTDMYFKPVPESKLARKREERARKAAGDEGSIANKLTLPPGFAHVPSDHYHHPPHSTSHSVMPRVSPHHSAPSMMSSSYKLQELERFERERKEEFLRLSMGSRHPGCPTLDPFDPRRGFTPGPPPHPPHSSIVTSVSSAQSDGRRLEELARANAERQYAERISALATDPLVRLQMAGVNPEMPPSGHSSHLHVHPGFNPLLPPGPGRPPHPPVPGLDPRFNPNDLMGLRYPPPGLSHPELLQRQLMLEREILVAQGAAAAQHQSLMAQQEEFLRLEQEARARQNRQ